jgi:hypothetical protein
MEKKTVRRPESIPKLIIRSLLSPSVLTVIATAIVGPLLAQIVVNQLKEAELETNRILKETELETNRNIEQKKLQTDILQRVFKSTDESDFTDPSQVSRLASLVMMVNENSDTFGLKFDSSFQNLKSFRENLEDSEINAAQLQKEETEKEKTKLEEEKKIVEEEKARLQADLDEMNKKLKKAKNNKKRIALKDQIAATTRALEDAMKMEAEFKTKIEGLNAILSQKTQKINQLKDDLGKRLKENEELQQEIDGFKKLTRERETSIKELKAGLKAASKSLKEQSDTISQLEANLKVAQAEKERAEEKLRICETPPVQKIIQKAAARRNP